MITLSVNPGNYLEKNLRDVIGDVEINKDVELIAIGIGHMPQDIIVKPLLLWM